jgi:hypothetical protein
MVQQCSENQYLWEHFTVYMCVERPKTGVKYAGAFLSTITSMLYRLFCVKFFSSSPVGRCQMFVVSNIM